MSIGYDTFFSPLSLAKRDCHSISGRHFGSSFSPSAIFNPPSSQGCLIVACAKMAAASFPWFVNPWDGVRASDAPTVASDAPVGAPMSDLPDFDGDLVVTPPATAAAAFPWFVNPWDGQCAPAAVVAVPPDADDPLVVAAAVAVDELITAARLRAERDAVAAAAAADAVVLRLAACGICGDWKPVDRLYVAWINQ